MIRRVTYIALLVLLIVPLYAQAEECPLRSALIPDHVKGQFAGNMGFLSFGAGYSFFDGKLESDLFYGYVAESKGGIEIQHLTQKNTWSPFRYSLREDLSWQPLTVSTSFLYKVGNYNRETWLFLPERYPKRYYFATAFHALFSLGSALEYRGPGVFKGTGLYVEAGSTALYISNWLLEEYVSLSDIVSLGIGIKKTFN